MILFLRGLLLNLRRRSEIIKERLLEIPDDSDLNDYVARSYQQVEDIRRRLDALINDSDLGEPRLLPNYLQAFRECTETLTVVEHYGLPQAERFTSADRRLTRLCRRLVIECEWPLPPPLVSAASSDHYWTSPYFNLVCVPALEERTLLSLPDLAHELGHILLFHEESQIMGDFRVILARYIASEKQRVSTEQRPPEYESRYHELFRTWSDRWVFEFACDMIATYMVGVAFVFQHVRLCVGYGHASIHHPCLGSSGDHPADDARFRGSVAVLERLSAPRKQIQRIEELWLSYLETNTKPKPPDYEFCYPQHLINELAECTIGGMRRVGVRCYSDFEITPNFSSIIALLQSAWLNFDESPLTYQTWEDDQLQMLWNEL